MNIIKIRGMLSCIALITMLTFLSVFLFNECGRTIMGIINRDDYIFYTWVTIPAFLSIPVMICGIIFFLCALLPQRDTIIPFLLRSRLIMLITIYSFAAIVIGSIASIVVSIYPLGVHYYQCEHSSIMSGSHYARTKLICEQRKYSPTK